MSVMSSQTNHNSNGFQQLVANNKENIIVLRHWPFMRGIHQWSSQRIKIPLATTLSKFTMGLAYMRALVSITSISKYSTYPKICTRLSYVLFAVVAAWHSMWPICPYSPRLFTDTGEIARLPLAEKIHFTVTSWWARWRLKSSVSRLFTQPFIQAQINENIIAPRHWPLCGEVTGHLWISSQRASKAENVSIWWRHHTWRIWVKVVSIKPQQNTTGR